MSEPIVEITPAGNPWDRRQETGFLGGLLGTIRLFVVSPVEAFERTRETGDYGGPLLFAVLVGWVFAAVGQMWQLVFGASLTTWLPPELAEQLGLLGSGSWTLVVAQLLLAPVYIVFGLFLSSAILHSSLWAVGGLAESRSGFEGSFRVLSFATVANLAQLLPLVGSLIALVWWVVLVVIGFSRLHRTSAAKALVAVLIPLLLCCLCGAAVIAVSGAALWGLLGSG